MRTVSRFIRLRDAASDVDRENLAQECCGLAIAEDLDEYNFILEEGEDWPDHIQEILIRALQELPMDEAYCVYSRIRDASDDELSPLAFYCLQQDALREEANYIARDRWGICDVCHMSHKEFDPQWRRVLCNSCNKSHACEEDCIWLCKICLECHSDIENCVKPPCSSCEMETDDNFWCKWCEYCTGPRYEG